MAFIETFTCVCGVQKKNSNHWVLARFTPPGIDFMPWDSNLARSSDVITLCGEGCAAALLSRSLGEWKLAHLIGIPTECTSVDNECL
jgi:hypothetical protein